MSQNMFPLRTRSVTEFQESVTARSWAPVTEKTTERLVHT